MTAIHELIPAESDKVAVAKALTEEAVATFSKRTDHFLGHNKAVTMYADDRQAENLADVKEVVTTVDEKLDHVWGGLVKAIDVTATKEMSNTSPDARADVIVNGVTVLEAVPATALLGLERRVKALKDLYQSIPTLDPSFSWQPDTTREGVYVTAHAQEGHKTEKVLNHKVLVAATKEHPAQVEKYTMDENVAKVTVTRFSGMVSPADKARWMRRISDLETAVKEARQRANMASIIPLNVGERLHAFIHDERHEA